MDKQVFQTDSRSRWNKFKLTIGTLVVLIVVLTATFITMLFFDRAPGFPFHDSFKSALLAEKPLMKKNQLSEQYKGYRKFFDTEKAHNGYVQWKRQHIKKYNRYAGQKGSAVYKNIDSWQAMPAGLRAGFYVN